MAEQSGNPQVPESADHDPREAGFGPGEDGESIEDGRKGEQESGEQDSGDGDD